MNPPPSNRSQARSVKLQTWQIVAGIAGLIIASSTALGLAGSFFGVKLQSIHMPRDMAVKEHAKFIGDIVVVEKKAEKIEVRLDQIEKTFTEEMTENRLDTRALMRALSPRLPTSWSGNGRSNEQDQAEHMHRWRSRRDGSRRYL